MVIRNRLLAFLTRMVILVLLSSTLGAYLAEAATWARLLEFETEVAIIYLIVLGFSALFNLIDLRHGIRGIAAGFYMPMNLCLVGFCFVSNAFYFAYGLPTGMASSSINSIIFHAMFLALPTLEWLLFNIKGTVRWHSAFTAMSYPILYVVFMGFRALIWPKAVLPNGTMYPYPFLAPGWNMFVLWAILSFAVVYGVLLAYIFLNNFLAGKYRVGQEVNPF